MKKLSEMTLDELWELFPVILSEHQEYWKDYFYGEAQLLRNILPQEHITKITHIGSTTIDKIKAKPIIDILIEISDNCDISDVCDILVQNGYICMSKNDTRISLNKGYTENGFAEKVFHIHLRYPGDNDEIYFRDYLNKHPDVAAEYEKLKVMLAERYKHNRDAYTEAKSEFVSKYTGAAKVIYKTGD